MKDKERIEELGKEIPYYETEIYKETCEEVDNADGYDDLINDIIYYKKLIHQLENNQNAKAVEALERVKGLIEKKLDNFDNPETRITYGLFVFWIENEIDNLIKDYGGKE